MKDFDFTYEGFIALLSADGINSKGILKEAFSKAKTSDLEQFRNSINETIRRRYGNGKTVREAMLEKHSYLKLGFPFSIITKNKKYYFSNLADIKNKCTREEWDCLEKMNVNETRMFFEEYVIEVE